MVTSTMSVNTDEVYPPGGFPFSAFPSRRSVVHSTDGIVACTQPLAAAAGQRILRDGGNAAVRELLLESSLHYLK